MERHNPLDALLRAVAEGDLKTAREAAELLARGRGHNPMQLAAEVLHELRQPLLGIKGYVQMMEEDGAQRPTVPLVLAQVERMEQIISDFTRLASDQKAPMVRMELADAVAAARARFTQSPDASRIQLEVDLVPGVEVMGNARLLEQLVQNLLNNAKEALGGRGRIKVLVTREEGAAALYVADWGPGIAPELRERLFEPYATARQRGSGLGLAVCRRIAREHGGTIDLALPQRMAEQPPPATLFHVRFPKDEAAPAKERKRVLVVDDESVIRSIFRDLLSRECEVVEAATAEQALEHLTAQERFDLLITDKNLPGLSGLELAQRAHQLDPRSRVMMMTGYPSLVTAQQALELGLVEYLLKPFDDIRKVRERIRQVLSEPAVAKRPASSRRVDVYEDAPESAKVLCEALAQMGLVPQVLLEACAGGEEPPCAVVVSWDFGPARAGASVELAKRMSGGAPFVVMVEHLTMETTLEALRAGSSACLPKLLSDSRALGRELARALKLPSR